MTDGSLQERDWWWRVTTMRDDDGQQVVVVKLAADTALAVGCRDGWRRRPGAREVVRDIMWAIGEAVE